jgi:glycosyltransferase involved in cell wall biosynthesis
MRILILNRRDIANPASGGAEIYTQEIARGLTEKYGCEVVVFTSRFKGSTSNEMIDGVRYMRKGNEVTVHLWGFLYATRNRKKFDRIVDEFNGIGFFTFALPNSSLLIHQMYQEFWTTELGLLGKLPFLLEPAILKLYRNKKAITVSESTKEDLNHLGFKNVSVIMNAVRRMPIDISINKNSEPTLIFLGRLKSTKRPEDVVEIFRKVKRKIPNARLWMVGRGPEEDRLKSSTKELNDVTFWGWADNEKKMSLLAQAHVLLVPSVREGFGINVIEAASVGTPAIGYNVHGLRDSIRYGETGYLVGSVEEAAVRTIDLLGDKARYEKMSDNCLYYSEEFNWDKRVDEFWHEVCYKIDR